jgi:hypothetical protein
MAGKGSKPRNCHSKRFKENFDSIVWVDSNQKEFTVKKGKKIFKYK